MDLMEILTTVITSLLAGGGISGIVFYSLNKKLKHLEVEEKKVDVVRKQDDEWQELYREQRDRVKEAREECMRLRLLKEESTNKANKLELENQQLEWFRCTVNNCKMRKPPHLYDADGNEVDAIV